MFVLDGVCPWLEKLCSLNAFPKYKIFTSHQNWVGHSLFVKGHKFFECLPVNCAMNWEYQSLASYGRDKHWGLYEIDGEEPIVSLVGYPLDGIATSMGVVKCGKGRIVFSSLEIPQNLTKEDNQSAITRRLAICPP